MSIAFSVHNKHGCKFILQNRGLDDINFALDHWNDQIQKQIEIKLDKQH